MRASDMDPTHEQQMSALRYARVRGVQDPRELLLLYPPPEPNNHWGVLSGLQNTSWGANIPTVSGEALSHALHGHTIPLIRQLGVPPRARLAQTPNELKTCQEFTSSQCALFTPSCSPGSGDLPDCYSCPADIPLRLSHLVTVITKAWDEGRYVFTVDGPEFIFR